VKVDPQASTFPTSYAQRRLWFIQTMSPSSTAYNMVFSTPLPVAPDCKALQWSFNALVSRHENLRTSFAFESGEPIQLIANRGELPLQVHELREGPAAFTRIVSESAAQPFDLAKAPLARVHVGIFEGTPARLALVIHHIVADGQTIRVLMEDLDAMYRARALGQIPVLPELAIEYADYAVWQRRSLTGRRLDNLTEYWKRRLQDLPELDLHPDHARSANGSYRGGVVPFHIPADVTARLRELAVESKATLFAALLAGFSAVLTRFSGQTSFGIGIPVSDRAKPELQRVAGLFINSLVFRADVAAEASFEELVRHTGSSLVEDLTHHDLPFELVVDALGVKRRADRNPLFQVMFQLQMRPDRNAPSRGEQASRGEFDELTSQLDISFIQYEGDAGQIEGGAVYAADLFDGETIAQLVDAYLRMLSEAGRQTTTALAELALLGANRRNEVLALGQGDLRAWPQETLLHQLFEEQARRSPDSVAVETEGSSLSFEQLDRRSASVAASLCSMDVGPGSIVAICLPRSTELVIAILGVLRAGGAYLVLDSESPRDRLDFIVSDCNAAAVIAPQGREDLASGRRLVQIDAIASTVTPRPAVAPSHEDPAYVIYTSGSTGQPKGVLIPHRAIVNHMRWMLDRFPLADTDRVLQRTPLTFDASVWELWAPLVSGAVMVLAPEGKLFDPTRLAELIQRQKITTLQAVPSVLRALLDHGEIARCTTLRRVFCGGEPLTPEIRDKFFSQHSAELCNLYGPSETTIDATFHVCRRDSGRNRVPIGRPIANVVARVFDERLQPVPCGVAGELCIGGAAVGIGYIGRQQLTAERFIDDPCSPGGRLFRTGDRVRMSHDGELQFLGRLDDQVKLRGFRIEPGEIEAVLMLHPAVSEAAAVVLDNGGGDQRLVGFVAATDGGSHGLAPELLGWLRSRLPAYQVPSLIEVRASLPKTAHGKIDRRTLARSVIVPGGERGERCAPRTELERQICACFGEVLKIDGIGIDDDFFLLGGHSLLVVSLCEKLSRAVGSEVSIVDAFEYPTARQLAEAIAARTPRQASRGSSQAFRISSAGR
jgi:amino acid adenylation domain-containing protein